MNERIIELAEQADIFADSKLQMKGEYHPDWHDIRDEKFAELILKDVFNRFGDEILSLHYLEQGCCQDSVHLLKSKIQEHFGIQE
jgi:hypothetical protein